MPHAHPLQGQSQRAESEEDIGRTNGFDIAPNGEALAASGARVYRIDLGTGRARLVGLVPGSVTGLAFRH
ncbi:uncharacterized protein DUF4394 [Saccharothrix carnea]|uniref:Uncharacterized protein DUF4394 n=1 Tax=Saccharothrix carnea TaxID=1280637 RepID=A0A2P8I0Q7_SACCR|nr:DUF4394 domain-containing protein [Saccharothrix carnea]PSL52051.1 uncharacterized protein DUF4394 [Saccharothrix carnea]